MPAEPVALDVREPAGMNRWLQLALMGLIVFLGGMTPVAARFALEEMPCFTTGFLRFGIAGVCLLITLQVLGPRDPRSARRIDRADLPRFALCALLCVPINQACFLSGVKLAGAAHAGLLYALNPVLVFIITLSLGLVTASARLAAAALLAFAGAAIIGVDSLMTSAGPSLAGDGLIFLAVLSWSSYSVAVGPLGVKYGPLRALTIIILTGVLLYSPALLVDGARLNFAALTPSAWAGFLFISFGTSFLSYLLWLRVLMLLNVNRLSVAMSASPLVAVIGANRLCGEQITGWLAVGGLLVLFAITLANWHAVRDLIRSRKRPPTSPLGTAAES